MIQKFIYCAIDKYILRPPHPCSSCFAGRSTSQNNALPLHAVNYYVTRGLHTPSPGDKHRLEEELWGPVQRRRECGTLYDSPSILHTITTM
jgi:hypothetical protein